MATKRGAQPRDPNKDKRSASKQKPILAAASRLFRRYGVRGTTMEAIAGEAGVAKATAYAYFADKEAVFQAVCLQVSENILERVDAVCMGKAGQAQVAGVLCAKFGLVFDLVYGSPHATEILQSSDEHAKLLFERTDGAFLKALEASIRRGAEARALVLPPRAKAKEIARMLFRASEGLMQTASDAEELKTAIHQLVGWLLAS
jgi:AcrR family transcriptional regulator